MKDLIKRLLREHLTLNNKTKDILDDVTDEKIGEEHFESWEYTDEIGGRAFGTIKMEDNDRVAGITQMNSQPSEFRHDDTFKRRGFFTNLLQELKNNGVNKVVINLQSKDTRNAVSRLIEKGILKNPTNLRGVSVDMYPTKFDI